MREKYKGLRGTVKRNMLIKDQAELLAFYHLHGPEATKKEFGIKRDDTLDNIVNYKPDWKRREEEKLLERFEYRLIATEQQVREYHHEQIELKKQYEQFVPAVSNQLLEKFFKPLVRLTMKLPRELEIEEVDPLSLENFNPRVGKNEAEEH